MGCRDNSRLWLVAILCTTVALACGRGSLGTSSSSDGGLDSTSSGGSSGGSGMDSSTSDESASSSGADSGGSGSTSSGGVGADSGGDGPGDGSDGSFDSSSGSIPCFEADDAGGDGGTTYQCTVTQIRRGGCAEAWPPNYPGPAFGDAGNGAFTMKIDGNCVEVTGSFVCSGTWNGDLFKCTITGWEPSYMTACPGTLWEVCLSGQCPESPLPGQIWTGTDPSGNGFNAICQ